MKASQMVTIERLKESQRTRPRHWIPVYCAIVLIFALTVFLAYIACVLPMGDFSKTIYDLFPNLVLTIGSQQYGKDKTILILILPAALLLVNLFALIVAIRMANFRHAYWWYAVWVLLAYIGMGLFDIFWNLYTFVPAFQDIMKFMSADVIAILGQVFVYGNIAYSGMLLISLIFGLFYCVNYPAKYERIYALRKRHMRSLPKLEDQVAYRKKFYRDYRLGKWISMMLDLHSESLKQGLTTRMDQDAYEFLVYYSCLCDSNVKKAVFDEYARNGRYYECRAIFHDIKAKSEAIDAGAKVYIPTYTEPVTPKIVRRPKRPEPAPKPAPKRKHYRPDEI